MTQMHLCKPDDFDKLEGWVDRCHQELGIASTPEDREAGLRPLLEGSPLGCAYLLGPARAPVGYVVLTFGWSVEHAGMDANVDEIFIRKNIRKRGLASEALHALSRDLGNGGIRALHLNTKQDLPDVQRLFEKSGFAAHEKFASLTKSLT